MASLHAALSGRVAHSRTEPLGVHGVNEHHDKRVGHPALASHLKL